VDVNALCRSTDTARRTVSQYQQLLATCRRPQALRSPECTPEAARAADAQVQSVVTKANDDENAFLQKLCLPRSPSARPRATRIGSTRAPADGFAAGEANLAATGPFCDPRWYARPAVRPRGRRPRRVLPPRRPRS
jgi:hypothetical protein